MTSGLLLNLDLRAGAVTSSRKEKVHGTSTPHRPPVGACVRRYRNRRVQMNSDQVDTVSKPPALVGMSTQMCTVRAGMRWCETTGRESLKLFQGEVSELIHTLMV